MIKQIKRSAFWAGAETPQYFHPSVCTCKNGLLMTLQTFEGMSDTYGPVMFSLSKDEGDSWSEPQAIEALKHCERPDGVIEGIADVRPIFHHQSETVIAIGCNTYYSKNGYLHHDETLKNKKSPQFPVYAVRHADGSWSERKELKVNFFKDCLDWRVACTQMLILPDGDILIPIYFNKGNGAYLFNVCSVRCAFDGETLTAKTVSNVLSLDINRGLIEPSLAVLNDRYYMTIRAEDSHGYFSVSDDGLSWGEIAHWCWDDGEALTMSTTQQHWVCNGKNLFLVYTRQTGFNDDAMRWRAPLFIARFDEKHDCLLRDTEQEVFPLVKTNGRANQLGNFHAVDISPAKSIVSVGSMTLWTEDGEIQNFCSNTWLAEIDWA